MPSDVRFAELRTLLERHGWTLARISGSHHFRGEGRGPLSIPVHKGRVKWFYAKEVRRAIDGLGKGGGTSRGSEG